MRLHRLVLLFCVVVVAGCGSSSAGGGNAGADPAQAIPAGTFVYFEGSIRPSGGQGDAARALLEKFLPAGTTLAGLMDQQFTSHGEKATYATDIKPWLGERVGFGVTDLTATHPTFIGSIAITNAGKADKFLAKDGKPAGEYKGAKLFTDADLWAGVKGAYLVVAEDKAHVEQGLDTTGKSSLGDSSTYKTAVAALPSARLGTAYVDTKGVVGLLDSAPGLGAPQRAVLKQFLGNESKPLTAALTATDTSATIESHVGGALGIFGGTAPTDLLKDVPADAFAAFGAGDVGSSIKQMLNTLAGSLGGAALTTQVERQTGLDLDRDLFSWIGDAAVYVRGSTMASLTGALTIGVKDEAAAKAAFPRLIAAATRAGAPVQKVAVPGAAQAFSIAAPSAPGPIVLALGGARAVAAFGTKAAAAALKPAGDTLASSGRYDDAKRAIDGVSPTLIVSIPTILALIDNSGHPTAQYEQAKPYLQKLDAVITGSEKTGDLMRVLLTVTTK